MTEEWLKFCDAARVAPDTLTSSALLATRYEKATGQPITAEAVRELRGGDTDEALEAAGRRFDRFAATLFKADA